MLENIAVGTIVAVVWGGFSYALAKAKNGETFSPLKFFKTVVIGIILAGFSESLGLPLSEVEGLSVTALLTIVVDKVAGLFLKEKTAT